MLIGLGVSVPSDDPALTNHRGCWVWILMISYDMDRNALRKTILVYTYMSMSMLFVEFACGKSPVWISQDAKPKSDGGKGISGIS